jgi:hypothetical protein
LQYTSDFTVVLRCMNSTTITPCLACWMCVHQLLWLLFSFNIHKWNPCFITCYSYDVIRKFIAIFVVLF